MDIVIKIVPILLTIATGQPSSAAGGTGYIIAQMKVQTNFPTWDFTDTWKITNGAYPKLEW